MHNSAEIFSSHEIACKQVAHSNTTIARLGPHPQRLCPCIWNCCLLDCRLLHKGRIISWCTPRSTPQGGPCISSAVHRLVPAFHVMPGCCPNVPHKAWLPQHTCPPIHKTATGQALLLVGGIATVPGSAQPCRSSTETTGHIKTGLYTNTTAMSSAPNYE